MNRCFEINFERSSVQPICGLNLNLKIFLRREKDLYKTNF